MESTCIFLPVPPRISPGLKMLHVHAHFLALREHRAIRTLVGMVLRVLPADFIAVHLRQEVHVLRTLLPRSSHPLLRSCPCISIELPLLTLSPLSHPPILARHPSNLRLYRKGRPAPREGGARHRQLGRVERTAAERRRGQPTEVWQRQQHAQRRQVRRERGRGRRAAPSHRF